MNGGLQGSVPLSMRHNTGHDSVLREKDNRFANPTNREYHDKISLRSNNTLLPVTIHRLTGLLYDLQVEEETQCRGVSD